MSNADQVELFFRLLLAVGIGATIGLEREWRGHEAGIRTSAFVCVGAAIFGELSTLAGDSRIAAGVVQGVGFLGAGLIFHHKNGPAGVTSASTVWVIAGIGLMVANHLWLTSLLLGAAVFILLELGPVSDWVFKRGRQWRRRKGLPEPRQT